MVVVVGGRGGGGSRTGRAFTLHLPSGEVVYCLSPPLEIHY